MESIQDVCVVSGAGGGIGRTVARRLVDAGIRVAAFDLDLAAAQATIDGLGSGALSRPYGVDVTNKSHVVAAVKRAEADLGRLTMAVACAGVISTALFLELTETQWDRTLAVNTKGVLFLLQAAGSAMVGGARGGSMVVISSVAGRSGRALNADYAASKAAAISLSRSAALALAADNISVNAVCPGVITTPMTGALHEQRAHATGTTVDASLTDSTSRIPLGRQGAPDEVAHVVLSLLQPAGRYVTGQAINVCGGFLLS